MVCRSLKFGPLHYFVKDHQLVAIWRTGAIRDAVVINGFTEAGIKCYLDPESNPDYVPSRASLIFGSGYIDCTYVVRTDLVIAATNATQNTQTKIAAKLI